MDEARPDPDALLRRFRAEEERSHRAKLKIFFGFAPGVGKTYAMLESARHLVADGVEVVVGCVETHGRAETAELLEGLTVLPRRVVEYRGATLEELDLEAALARKPAILLVDELAHTNAPGSRHLKRWQDVMDLLDAGVDVHTTLNVQHVESLNDVIEQITGVRVREIVPDTVLERADEIELIDLPAEELLERLREGKVYLPERAARAADHFFQRGNLLALRELALRRTAARVDADVLAHRREQGIVAAWPAAERILVCVGPGPGSARLIRAARRIAEGAHAPWLAVHVMATSQPPVSEADQERLEAHLRLAESLGAQIVRLDGHRVSEALLAFARQQNVTRIVAGTPTHGRWRDLLRGSLLDDLIRGSGDIDIQVIGGDVRGRERAEPRAADGERRGEAPSLAPYGWSVALLAATTGLCGVAFQALSIADVAMIYLLAIMLAAALMGRGPAILAASLAVATFDFFFVPPRFTFAVTDVRHLLTFAVMYAVGLIISTLTVRLRRQESAARLRETRTAALLGLTRELGPAGDVDDIAAILARHLEEVFDCSAAILVPQPDGQLIAVAGLAPLSATEEGVARWSFEHGQEAGRGTATLPGAKVQCVPLRAGDETVGVAVLQAHRGSRALDIEQRHLLDAFLRQVGLAIERSRLMTQAREAALRVRTEELRSSLLSAVSHDLRTPLAVITGAATTLRDAGDLSPAQRREMLDTVCEEARRLERILANLLDMTRMQDGIEVAREWVPLEEVVGAALARLEPELAGRSVEVALPETLPLVPVDPVLLQQVFVNLLDNASKYSDAGGSIEISARALAGDTPAVEVEIADRGPGLPIGDEQRVFERFFRGKHGGVRGVGLGLSICRAIVLAHGGTLVATNRPEGGASFRFTLPLVGTPPEIPAEEPEGFVPETRSGSVREPATVPVGASIDQRE